MFKHKRNNTFISACLLVGSLILPAQADYDYRQSNHANVYSDYAHPAGGMPPAPQARYNPAPPRPQQAPQPRANHQPLQYQQMPHNLNTPAPQPAQYGHGQMMQQPQAQQPQMMMVPVPAQPQPSGPPSVMEQALALHRAGRFADAVHIYESIIYSTAPDPRLYASIADAHFKLSNNERALKYAVEALKLDPGYSSGHLLLGTILAEMGDNSRAVRSFKKVLVLDQNNPYAYYNLGLLHYKQSDIKAAISYLERARDLNPRNAKTWNNLGVVYYDQGLYSQALIAFTEATRLNPHYSSAVTNLNKLKKEIPNTLDRMPAGQQTQPNTMLVNRPTNTTAHIVTTQPTGHHPQPYAQNPAPQMPGLQPPSAHQATYSINNSTFKPSLKTEEFQMSKGDLPPVMPAPTRPIKKISNQVKVTPVEKPSTATNSTTSTKLTKQVTVRGGRKTETGETAFSELENW